MLDALAGDRFADITLELVRTKICKTLGERLGEPGAEHDDESNVGIVGKHIFMRRGGLSLGSGRCLFLGRLKVRVPVDFVEEFQDAVALLQLDVGLRIAWRGRQR